MVISPSVFLYVFFSAKGHKKNKNSNTLNTELFFRYHLERGYAIRVPGKPQEIHPWHQNGVRWFEETKRARRSYRLPKRGHKVKYLGNITK